MMALAAVLAVVSVWLGLTLSYHWDIAASATMALIPIVVFFVVLTVTKLRRPSARQLEQAR